MDSTGTFDAAQKQHKNNRGGHGVFAARRMNGGGVKKFGGGRVPTGTPSLALSSVVVVVSLLAGASVVHNIYKPDMTLPPVEAANGGDTSNHKEN